MVKFDLENVNNTKKFIVELRKLILAGIEAGDAEKSVGNYK